MSRKNLKIAQRGDNCGLFRHFFLFQKFHSAIFVEFSVKKLFDSRLIRIHKNVLRVTTNYFFEKLNFEIFGKVQAEF